MRSLLMAGLLAAALLGGCGTDDPPSSGSGGGVGSDAELDTAGVTTSATFGPYAAGAEAVTYDPALVPAGSTVQVTVDATNGTTLVRMTVEGLVADRAYGAHLHAKPCGETGDAAGPHVQHSHDPAAAASPPSVDPSYANPENEVWLDFTTDGTGAGQAESTQRWTFDAGQEPRSLVIHAQATKTEAGVAGTAGARLACLSLPAE